MNSTSGAVRYISVTAQAAIGLQSANIAF